MSRRVCNGHDPLVVVSEGHLTYADAIKGGHKIVKDVEKPGNILAFDVSWLDEVGEYSATVIYDQGL